MQRNEGQSGEERRRSLLEIVKKDHQPVKAVVLAGALGVTRQVIVQDIALLRAKGEPLLATSRGYIYQGKKTGEGINREILCQHTVAQTQTELNTMVDHGLTVVDVAVEHPYYGRIRKPLGLRSRLEVARFMAQIAEKETTLLSSLTNGLHRHTVEAPSQEALEQACQALTALGIFRAVIS